jgi:hypothetical protein
MAVFDVHATIFYESFNRSSFDRVQKEFTVIARDIGQARHRALSHIGDGDFTRRRTKGRIKVFFRLVQVR